MSSSITKVLADAQAEASKLEKQRAEDQRDQLSKELVDMKNQLKDSKAEISKLVKVLEKVKDLVMKNNMEIACINTNSRKLVEFVQNVTNPCKNYKGSKFCLDGQVVGSIPRTGTVITAPKDTKYKDYRGVQVSANDTGVVDNGNPNHDNRPIR